LNNIIKGPYLENTLGLALLLATLYKTYEVLHFQDCGEEDPALLYRVHLLSIRALASALQLEYVLGGWAARLALLFLFNDAFISTYLVRLHFLTKQTNIRLGFSRKLRVNTTK